jgi:aquaporin Z
MTRAAADPAAGAPLRAYAAEFAGTALLVFGGISAVIVMMSPASPLPHWLPDPALRRFITGGLFGLTGTAVTLSPLGRCSGAHINPAVTLAFWLERRIGAANAVGYVTAQMLGGMLGASALHLWGRWGAPLAFGVTQPGAGVGVWAALGYEAAVTFALVTTIFVLLARPATRRYTAWSMGPLFALLVWLEAPLTGTSANPARSFGPAWANGLWNDAWIYWAGPPLGAIAAVVLIQLEVWGRRRVREARLAHFRLPSTG